MSQSQPPVMTSKPHYPILDGLRGVASVVVVIFHLLETHATSHFDQIINHGYLAVDFFFLLSGFVIGYAYDDRWNRMSVGTFFKRRLIRLQPMVVMGMAVGALCFYFQDSALWPAIHEVPVWKMLLIMVIGMTLIPVPVSMDIRGWQEMHPLNGPGWSLFFEYIANILYALVVRKFPKWLLTLFVLAAGGALIHLAVTSPGGDLIGGWSVTGEQLRIGFTRLVYPFFAGLLLYRLSRPARVKGAFLWCSLLVVAALSMPRIGGEENLWMNGLYDSLTVIALFPLIVWMGTSSWQKEGAMTRVCKFLGDISFPLYITHFPLVCIYMGWVSDRKPSLAEALPVAAACFIGAIALAYASLKLYDEPVRAWLTRKVFPKRAA